MTAEKPERRYIPELSLRWNYQMNLVRRHYHQDQPQAISYDFLRSKCPKNLLGYRVYLGCSNRSPTNLNSEKEKIQKKSSLKMKRDKDINCIRLYLKTYRSTIIIIVLISILIRCMQSIRNGFTFNTIRWMVFQIGKADILFRI